MPDTVIIANSHSTSTPKDTAHCSSPTLSEPGSPLSSSVSPNSISSVPRSLADPDPKLCQIPQRTSSDMEKTNTPSLPGSPHIDPGACATKEAGLLAGVAVAQTPAPPTASLYVGDLSPMVNETDLFRAFSPIGCILSIRVCRDVNSGKSLGYAYVNYQSTADASRALATLNHIKILGKPCQIMPSQRDPNFRKGSQGNIFIKNLDVSVNETILRNKFQPYGDIIACKVAVDEKGISRGYGYVNYSQSESAEQAISDLNGTKLADKVLFVGQHISKRDRINKLEEKRHQFTNIYVRNIDHTVTPREFHDLFNQYGTVISISLPTKDMVDPGADPESPKITESQGYGFVNFASHEDALNAINNLNKKAFKGSELFVSRAQKKNEREFERKQRHFYDKAERFINYNAGNMANLYIKNLDASIDDEYLYQTFSPFGKITSARVMTDDANRSRGYGFVCFSNYNEAIRTIHDMDATIHRGKPISISLAQRKDVNQGGSGSRNALLGYINPSLIPGTYPTSYPIMYQPILGKVANVIGGPHAPVPIPNSIEDSGFIPINPNMPTPPSYGSRFQYFSPLPPQPLPESGSGPSLPSPAIGTAATVVPSIGPNPEISPSIIPYLAGAPIVSPILSSSPLSSPTSPSQSTPPSSQSTFDSGVSPPNLPAMIGGHQGHSDMPMRPGSNSNVPPYYYYVPSVAPYQYGYGGINPNYPVVPGAAQVSGFGSSMNSPSTKTDSKGMSFSPATNRDYNDSKNWDNTGPLAGSPSNISGMAANTRPQLDHGYYNKTKEAKKDSFENKLNEGKINGKSTEGGNNDMTDLNDDTDDGLIISLLRTSITELEDPEIKKQMVGEAIYPHVLAHPEVKGDMSIAGKITGVMLDIDLDELINWVDRQPNILHNKINEAYVAYQAYIGQQNSDTIVSNENNIG